ncbi:MAG: glycosyltransferase family 39 protein [Chloroflexota bacterium]
MNSWKPSRELWLLLAITTLGAFLRFFRLSVLPPGDGYDVAQYGVDALQILSGARPVFLEANFGREALFSYLVAGIYLITGPGAWGIRFAGALVGTLTIPANFLVAREMVPDRYDVIRYLPLLVAFLTAVSYWHLNWSRMGLRVILVPLVASLLFFFLWRGLRRGGWTDFALAGFVLGVGFYTYQAARLLPVLAVIAFLLQALSKRQWTRRDTASTLLVAGIALLVYMPMGLYAREHPGALTERINQAVLIDPDQPLAPQLGTLSGQALDALAMYGIRGDTDPMFNVPGRPSLNPFLFAFLLVGIGIALWRFRRPTYLFLLAWLGVMTAPAMIADMAATAKRALGAFPPAVILIALGLLVPWVWLRAADNRRTLARLYGIGLAVGLGYTVWSTYHDYFVVWAADPDLPNHYQVEYGEIGRAISDLPDDDRVYLSPYTPDQPAIQLHSNLRADVRGYNGRFCLPYPDPQADAPDATYIIVPGLQDKSLDLLNRMYPTGTTEDGPLRPSSDRPYYRMFTVPTGAQPVVEPDTVRSDTWDGDIQLVGFSLSNTALAPGDTLVVDLFYRPLSSSLPDYTAFVHLLGPASSADGSPLWAQSDSPPCQGAMPTSNWVHGDIIRDTITLTISPDLPPGDYQVVTGFYSWPDLTRLPLDGSGETAATLLELEIRSPE